MFSYKTTTSWCDKPKREALRNEMCINWFFLSFSVNVTIYWQYYYQSQFFSYNVFTSKPSIKSLSLLSSIVLFFCWWAQWVLFFRLLVSLTSFTWQFDICLLHFPSNTKHQSTLWREKKQLKYSLLKSDKELLMNGGLFLLDLNFYFDFYFARS